MTNVNKPRKPIRIFFLLGIVGLSNATFAQERVKEDYNAEQMLRLCKGEVRGMSPDMQSLVCTFRIQGLADLMIHNCESIEFGYRPAPQLSASIIGSTGAIRQTFVNYMEDHPEIWGDYWSFALSTTLSESFPCEN